MLTGADGPAGAPSGQATTNACGNWEVRETADGRSLGVLTFDPDLLARPAAVDRLVQTVQAAIAVPVPGSLAAVDLVAAPGAPEEAGEPPVPPRVRLVTALPGTPTLADRLADPGMVLTGAAAAVLLLDVAATLHRLRAAERAHGALTPAAVVLGADGVARLRETGLLAALLGRPAGAGDDLAAWQELVGVVSAPVDAADPLRPLLATAGTCEPEAIGGVVRELAGRLLDTDVAAARRELSGSAPSPAVPAPRRTTHPAAAGVARSAETLGPPRKAATPARKSSTSTRKSPSAEVDRYAVTMLPPERRDRPAPGSPTAASDRATLGAVPRAPREGQDAADRAQEGSAGATSDVLLRFGPGVPAAAGDRRPTAAGRVRPGSSRSGRSRGRRVVGVLSTAVLIGFAVWLLWPRHLHVRSATADAHPSVATCGQGVDLVALVRTDGHRGTLRYRWLRNDGYASPPLHETLSRGQRSAELHLAWTVVGSGHFDGRATLQIDAPASLTVSTAFSYRC